METSNRKHLIITGSRGIGKTTLLSKLFTEIIPGLTSWAIRGDGVYLKENLSDEVLQIGSFDISATSADGKMVPIADAFEVAEHIIADKLIASDSDWVSIDEIGYLESSFPEYQNRILKLMECKRAVLVVRKQNTPFIQKLCLREDAFVIDLDNPFPKCGCIIMASGLGNRFGGNKLITELGNKPIIQWVIDATDRLFDDQVVVTRHPEVKLLCDSQNLKTILHNCPYKNDTVRLGLTALTKELDFYAFFPGDQPMISSESIMTLLLLSKHFPDNIWRTKYNDAIGAPVLFPVKYMEELLNLPTDKGGNEVVKSHNDKVQLSPVAFPYELMDIDTRQDLTILSQSIDDLEQKE